MDGDTCLEKLKKISIAIETVDEGDTICRNRCLDIKKIEKADEVRNSWLMETMQSPRKRRKNPLEDLEVRMFY